MSILRRCPFYREVDSLSMGRVPGHCDLCDQAICEGDTQSCENPDGLRRTLLEQRKQNEVLGNKREEGPQKKSRTYKILVVDDDNNVTTIVGKFLFNKGHQYVTASNSIEALSKMRQEKCDAVITDIVMPEVDGLALTKELLSLYPDLPIMIMTGFSNEYSSEMAMGLGAWELIGKPFSLGEFILRFNKMMSDHETSLEMESRQREMLFRLRREFFRVHRREINELQREIEK